MVEMGSKMAKLGSEIATFESKMGTLDPKMAQSWSKLYILEQKMIEFRPNLAMMGP